MNNEHKRAIDNAKSHVEFAMEALKRACEEMQDHAEKAVKDATKMCEWQPSGTYYYDSCAKRAEAVVAAKAELDKQVAVWNALKYHLSAE